LEFADGRRMDCGILGGHFGLSEDFRGRFGHHPPADGGARLSFAASGRLGGGCGFGIHEHVEFRRQRRHFVGRDGGSDALAAGGATCLGLGRPSRRLLPAALIRNVHQRFRRRERGRVEAALERDAFRIPVESIETVPAASSSASGSASGSASSSASGWRGQLDADAGSRSVVSNEEEGVVITWCIR